MGTEGGGIGGGSIEDDEGEPMVVKEGRRRSDEDGRGRDKGREEGAVDDNGNVTLYEGRKLVVVSRNHGREELYYAYKLGHTCI